MAGNDCGAGLSCSMHAYARSIYFFRKPWVSYMYMFCALCMSFIFLELSQLAWSTHMFVFKVHCLKTVIDCCIPIDVPWCIHTFLPEAHDEVQRYTICVCVCVCVVWKHTNVNGKAMSFSFRTHDKEQQFVCVCASHRYFCSCYDTHLQSCWKQLRILRGPRCTTTKENRSHLLTICSLKASALRKRGRKESTNLRDIWYGSFPWKVH